CGTDIGGAPTLALPYTFASCLFTISSSSQTKNCPLTGKPPIFLDSGNLVFCSSGRLAPPAPIKTKSAVWNSRPPVFKFLTLTCHCPLFVRRKSCTSCL